jgi:hypothetical protein
MKKILAPIFGQMGSDVERASLNVTGWKKNSPFGDKPSFYLIEKDSLYLIYGRKVSVALAGEEQKAYLFDGST